MLSSFWQWLQTASQGQASFLGTLAGSSIGLVALLLGALFNAHLNRKRDDRLRREEQRAVATALRTELAGCRRALLTNIQELEKEDSTPGGLVEMPVLAHLVWIMPRMIKKLGLLDEETIDKVANAYLAIEEHSDRILLFAGLIDPGTLVAGGWRDRLERTPRIGSRRLVSADKVLDAIVINKSTAEAIREAIDRLDVVASRRGAGRGRAEARLRRAWRWMRATG